MSIVLQFFQQQSINVSNFTDFPTTKYRCLQFYSVSNSKVQVFIVLLQCFQHQRKDVYGFTVFQQQSISVYRVTDFPTTRNICLQFYRLSNSKVQMSIFLLCVQQQSTGVYSFNIKVLMPMALQFSNNKVQMSRVLQTFQHQSKDYYGFTVFPTAKYMCLQFYYSVSNIKVQMSMVLQFFQQQSIEFYSFITAPIC